MDNFVYAKDELGLSREEMRAALLSAIEGRELKNVLIIPPDFTRFHSNAGYITNVYYHALTERGCNVDILPALGTHVPVTEDEAKLMFDDVPYEKFIAHNWRTDVVKLGEVPADYLEEITEGLWLSPVSVEVNRLIMDEKYDLIISPGQVVPHEVIGMANHSKNLFVGTGGSDMINKSHMVGAVYGMERMMGKDHTPVRKLFDYGMEHFLNKRPILFVLTVCTAPGGNIRTHGLFIGEDAQVDKLIRKYGYKGRLNTLEQFEKPENQDLRDNMGAAAHLIHGSSDGRFTITYAVKNISKEEIEGVGFCAADYDEAAKRYDPEKLQYGYNTLPDGEEIYFIPNPALGLWINREKF